MWTPALSGYIQNYARVILMVINEVASCLQSAAVNNDLLMQQDDSLPDGSYRYNILDAGGNTVAWVDIADFSGKQSTVSFYYARHNKDMYEAISSIIAQCKRVS